MAVNEITLPTQKRSIHLLTLFLCLAFFGLIIYFRNSLEDFSIPFLYVFLGIVLFSFIAGRFETFVLLLLIMTSTVFEMMEFPTVPIQIGDLYFSDILIILLLTGRLLKRATVNVVVLPRPMGYAVLAFILVAIFSFIYSILGSDVAISRAGVDLRTFFYLSLFFLVYYYIKSPRQLKSLLLGIGVIACVLAVLQVVQWAVGKENNFLYCRVEILEIAGRRYKDVSRVMFPGMSVILFTLNTILTIYVFKQLRLKWRLLLLPIIALLSLGILTTFSRSMWSGVLVSFALVLFLAHHRFSLYPRILLLLAGAGLSVFLILKYEISNSSMITEVIYHRSVSTVGAFRNFRDDTLFMRYMEYRYAWQKICDHPLLGIGFGNPYRPLIFGNNEYERGAEGTWVHNGYIAIQLRMGLLGTLTFLTMILLFFIRMKKRWKKIKDPLYRAVVLGIALSLVGMLIYNLTTSVLLYIYWIAIMGVGLGIVEKIYQFEGIS